MKKGPFRKYRGLLTQGPFPELSLHKMPPLAEKWLTLVMLDNFFVLHSPIFIQLTSCITVFSMYSQAEWKKSVDPDQLASEKPADQEPHCFQNGIYSGSAGEELMMLKF